MKTLKDEMAKLSQGTPEQVTEIRGHLKPVNLKKGDFLLRAGQVCRKYFFIESGSTSGEIFTDLESYLSQSESRINFEAIEASTVYVISKTDSDQLALKNNAYNTLLRRTVEISFVNLSRNVISFQSEEAAERYKRIENEKNWLSHYPLRYISSFIGVTQSSLSRLRARKK
jgi:signal-transduction protein with cAMP-binding, CBS, and nucleotidyltransferase domain